jgi:DNA-binding MarR family transcriptional regulator
VLAEVGTATFGYLKTALDLTDGNLGRHLETLAAEELVTIVKGYEGRRPRTWVTITDRGYAELSAEMAALKRLVAQFERAPAPAPPASAGLTTGAPLRGRPAGPAATPS